MDIIWYHRDAVLHLQAGVTEIADSDTGTLGVLSGETGTHVLLGCGDGGYGQADHGIQLGCAGAQCVEGLEVAS